MENKIENMTSKEILDKIKENYEIIKGFVKKYFEKPTMITLGKSLLIGKLKNNELDKFSSIWEQIEVFFTNSKNLTKAKPKELEKAINFLVIFKTIKEKVEEIEKLEEISYTKIEEENIKAIGKDKIDKVLNILDEKNTMSYEELVEKTNINYKEIKKILSYLMKIGMIFEPKSNYVSKL